MFDQLLTLNRFWQEYLEKLARDIPPEFVAVRPPQGNSALWIYGHLALCVEFAEGVLESKPLDHPRWGPVFGPGSTGDINKPERYSADQFRQMIRDGYPRFGAAMQSADTGLLAKPHNIEFLQPTPVKTNGDFLAHLLTTHFAFHAAQLSRCRREAGYQSLV